ncbi:zinc finger protein 678 [Eurosta solidaginis]|uniref:zinc finger protein 678 n=1 Tax=Eurosta solidaginis TaxID=178769 RepID=UPI003530BBD5
MAANGYIKSESVARHDVYDNFVGNSVEPHAEYFTYEDEDTEALIEYVEDDEVANNNEVVQPIKTHTLSVKERNTTEGIQEVYRCLECAIDFATVEDFTKVHRVIQKKEKLTLQAYSEDNGIDAEVECEQFNNQPKMLKQETGRCMEIKDDITKDENVGNIDEENGQEYSEMEEYIAECENITSEIKQFTTESNDLAKEAMVTNSGTFSNGDEDDDGEKYFCCDCQLIFGDLRSAEQHICSAINTGVIKNESASEEHFADPPGEEFIKLENLEEKQIGERLNMKADPTDLQYRCLQCSKRFNTLPDLQIHCRSHKTQQQKKLAKSNARIVVETESTTCPVCNTTFSSYKNLKLHMKIHKEQQLRPIEQALPAGAKQQYTDMNKFFCEICNKSFEQHLLGIHKNMHQQTKEYNCDICNRQLVNKISYEMHMQMHADKRVNSRQAQRKFVANNDDNSQGHKRFPCQYCGRSFQRPYEKVRHERIHTGEKPHACEVCGKKFRVPYSLTLHLRMHTDIRPYVCTTCNKRFKSKTVYVHHLRTHEPERSYKCEVCAKGFRTSVQLAAHRNIHLKPYSCPVCSRPFASLYYVKVHMKMHNKQNRTGDATKYSCYICGAVYARLPALRIHLKDLHLVDMDTRKQLQLPGDEIIKDKNSNSLSGDLEEVYDEEEKHEQNIENDEEEEHEVDHEAAVLIAAATEADCAAYIEAATTRSSNTTTPNISSMGLHSMQYEVTLEHDELIVDNYQTEEVVTDDWLAK